MSIETVPTDTEIVTQYSPLHVIWRHIVCNLSKLKATDLVWSCRTMGWLSIKTEQISSLEAKMLITVIIPVTIRVTLKSMRISFFFCQKGSWHQTPLSNLRSLHPIWLCFIDRKCYFLYSALESRKEV